MKQTLPDCDDLLTRDLTSFIRSLATKGWEGTPTQLWSEINVQRARRIEDGGDETSSS